MSAEEKFMALFGGGGGMGSLIQTHEAVVEPVQVQEIFAQPGEI